MMDIQLNGEKKSLARTLSVQDLLNDLSIPKEKVVVELNLEILPKDRLSDAMLKEGDQVEIVHFVGGGAPARALVIVESPTKCKTIHKYLGDQYEVVASMGHVIDLPKSKMGIDVENNFEPKYIVVKDRKKTLTDLKKRAKNKKEIYLACDPDREGEAISWHLKEALSDGKQTVRRIVFNEITKEAIQRAFKNPKDIDMNLVGAQQARRILDRLVGYNLSPLLWQKVGRGLSAGRVQSVALRLIVDQERKIQAFKPEEYWSVEAQLRKKSGDTRPFKVSLDRIENIKSELKNKAQADSALEEAKRSPFEVIDVKKQKKKRNPSAPLTTSKLQQAAYNRFRFPASKTMRVAQSLYEGVEVGEEGAVGLITYMRTDSVRISDEALKETREYILKNFGKQYLPAEPNIYKAKKAAQEAHEAIRPSSIARHPKGIEAFLTPDQFKLYSLIWEQTVASQMMPAIVAQDTADIQAGRMVFRASGSRVEFPGYLAVTDREDEQDNPLPELAINEMLELLEIGGHQHFTKPPARFTDASLVKALEERGIGRPSTYAPIIATLTGRDYVRRDGGSLVPTELGMLVTDLLVKHFSKVMDFDFTANLEEDLDEIEEGTAEWVAVVREFYNVFKGQIELAKDNIQTVKKVQEPTDEVCEKCGKPMVIKWGRRGRFMSCSGWPECKTAKSISTEVICPQCKTGKLVERRAKTGRGRPFYGCTTYPACTFIINRLPSDKPDAPQAPPGDHDKEPENFDIT